MIDYRLPAGLEETYFEDGGLWYKYNGRYLKSVGKILDTIYPMPAIDPWYLTRGKLIHKACCMIDSSTLDWNSLDPRIKPYCQLYRFFIETARPTVEASELVVVATDCSHGGRLDRVYRLPDRPRLIVTDIKTGSGKEHRYWLQCAAYACILGGDRAGDYDLALLNLPTSKLPHLNVAPDPGSLIQEWRKILADYKEANS